MMAKLSSAVLMIFAPVENISLLSLRVSAMMVRPLMSNLLAVCQALMAMLS
jgi:hypothetical protein